MKYKKIKLVILSLLATTLLVGCNLNKNNLEIGDIVPTEEVNKELDEKENLKTYVIVDENNKHGILDKDGNIIIEPTYEYVTPFQKDLAKFSINDKDGAINRNNHIIIEPIYEIVSILKDDYILAKPDKFTDYIFDSKGNLILETKNSSIEYLGQDLFAIKNDKGFIQVVNKNNEVIIPYEYNCSIIKLAKESLLVVYRPDKFEETIAQYLNFNGEPSINDAFSSAFPFEDGVAIVSKGNKFGAIDEKGNTVIEFKFDNLSNLKNLSSIATIEDKFGIVNKQGEITTEIKYDMIIECLYNEDFYIAKLNDKYGVIDKDNNIKIPFKYDMIYNINKNTFQLRLNDKISLVTKENKVILPLSSFDEATICNNLLLTEKDSKVNIVDLKTKESILKELNIISYIALNNDKVIKILDEKGKSYYLNTEKCKIVYQ